MTNEEARFEQSFEPVEKQFEGLFEGLMEEMIRMQQNKVLAIARTHYPHLTPEDILNPHDFPKLMADPIFNYEEGMIAGLMSAQMAVRAQLLRTGRRDENSGSES